MLPREHPLAGEARIELAELAVDPMLFAGGSCERPILDLYRHAGPREREWHPAVTALINRVVARHF